MAFLDNAARAGRVLKTRASGWMAAAFLSAVAVPVAANNGQVHGGDDLDAGFAPDDVVTQHVVKSSLDAQQDNGPDNWVWPAAAVDRSTSLSVLSVPASTPVSAPASTSVLAPISPPISAPVDFAPSDFEIDYSLLDLGYFKLGLYGVKSTASLPGGEDVFSPDFEFYVPDGQWSATISGGPSEKLDYANAGLNVSDLDNEIDLREAYITWRSNQWGPLSGTASIGLFKISGYDYTGRGSDLGIANPLSTDFIPGVAGVESTFHVKLANSWSLYGSFFLGKKIPENFPVLSEVIGEVDFNTITKGFVRESAVSLQGQLRREIITRNFFGLEEAQRDFRSDLGAEIPLSVSARIRVATQELNRDVNNLLAELPDLLNDAIDQNDIAERLASLGVRDTSAINALANSLEGLMVDIRVNDALLASIDEILRDAREDVANTDIVTNSDIINALLGLVEDIDPEGLANALGDVNRITRFLANHLDRLGVDDNAQNALIAYLGQYAQVRYDFFNREFDTDYDVEGLLASRDLPVVINHIRKTQGEDGVQQFLLGLKYDGDVAKAYLNVLATHIKGGASTFGDENWLGFGLGASISWTPNVETSLDIQGSYSDNKLGIANAIADASNDKPKGYFPSSAFVNLSTDFHAYDTDFTVGVLYAGDLITGISESFYMAAEQCVSHNLCIAGGYKKTRVLDEIFGADILYSSTRDIEGFSASMTYQF